MTPHQTPPSVPTDEMVEAFKSVYRAKVNELFAATHTPMKEEALTEAVRQGLTAALAAMPEVARGDAEHIAGLVVDAIKDDLPGHIVKRIRRTVADAISAATPGGVETFAWDEKAIADWWDEGHRRGHISGWHLGELKKRLTPSAIGAEGWSERETKVLRFALWKFAKAAREKAVAAGQHGPAEHVAAFLADAETADGLLARIPTPPTAQEGE